MKGKIVLILSLVLGGLTTYAQDNFDFKTVYDNKATEVKSQGNTGTCWAFSSTSFIESEILRLGGPSIDLSEMYFVKNTYLNKARAYVMMHGKNNFGQGGLGHDVINIIREYGFVQEADFYGRKDTAQAHNHTELELSLKSLLEAYTSQRNAKPTEEWFTCLQSLLNIQLGEDPENITFNKRNYTPLKFADALGIKPENYVELTSYTHHPYYQKFALEIPDNWAHNTYYNVPLDELINTMKEALKNGYTLVWDGDVSEKSFSHKNGVALLPQVDTLGFVPQAEIEVDAQMRQKAFFNWQATDDHLMHITGMVTDKNGKVYFKTKNSWGATSNSYGGYLYMSEAYVRMNTVSIMLHKDALDKSIVKKFKADF